MKIVAKTDRGMVRENNQDSYAVGEFPGEVAWAVVCDGMGGASGGNIASALAVKIISEKLNASYRDGMSDKSIKNMLDAAIVAANMAVYDMAKKNKQLSGMGTTVVCAVVRGFSAYIVHAGDSRAYLIDSNGIEQITTDHSVVQSLVQKGQLTPDQAKEHPSKNIITRALGVENRIQIDFDQIDLDYDQTILLCTDGLSNYLETDEIYNQVKDKKYYAFADRLVKKANENGGGDNITVVAIAK